MSHSLPVPSKGALRALRHLALGTTTCTVVVGIGLIAEDRRRRLSTFGKVYENGQRIKMARGYHSTETTRGSLIEERLLKDCEYGLSNGHDKQKGLDFERTRAPPETILHGSIEPSVKSFSKGELVEIKLNKPKAAMGSVVPLDLPRLENLGNTQIYHIPEISNQQRYLAWSMTQELTKRSNPEACDIAANIFFNSFTEGLQKEELSKPLLDACILLSRTCKRHGRIDTFIPVLKSILSCGPLQEAIFYRLLAPTVIARLLDESGFRPGHRTVVSVKKLEEAAAIFLTDFREKSSIFPLKMRKLGNELCRAAFQAKLYTLANEIYWRVSACRGDAPLTNVDILILASHERGYYELVPGYFTQLFPETRSSRSRFYTVVSAAVDSALELENFDKAEEILHVATKMARGGSIPTSISWFLRVIDDYWKTTRDLPRTQALFRRLETLARLTDNPQALYSAIIQFCVEDDNENEAKNYVDEFVDLNGSMSVRVYGHFALAKAMRNDWEGVESKFHAMGSIALESPSQYAAAFSPILKLFATSHNVSETESFLHLFIGKYKVIPDRYISNIMINKYCKAGEIDCIPKWIEYLLPLRVRIDAVTLNSILTNLRIKLNVPFSKLFRICQIIQSSTPDMIDKLTISILHRAAIKEANNDPHTMARLMRNLQSLKPSIGQPDVLYGMTTALDMGRPHEALRIYKHALQTRKLLSPRVVALAVTASVRTHGGRDLEPTICLIEDARLRGFNIAPSMSRLLLYQLQGIDGDTNDMETMVKRTITSLTSLYKRGVEISMAVTTQTASKLIGRGKCRAAIKLWTAISKLNNWPLKSIDIVSLTVLLRAYIAISDYSGIQWIMKMTAQSGINPDKYFKSALKNGRRQARKQLEAQPENRNAKLSYDLLNESVQQVVDLKCQRGCQLEEAERMILHIVETSTHG